MNDFKEWFFSESVIISNDIKEFPLLVGSGMRPVKNANRDELKSFVIKALKQHYSNYYQNLIDRYDVILKRINGYNEIIFNFELKPLGMKMPEPSNPEDYNHDYNLQYRNGKTGFYLHKSPKDAIQEIPRDPNLVYRGMSYEEWQLIKKRGFIKSLGDYNLGTVQNNLTFYSSAETAEYYANGFAPVQFQTSIKKPSVVIAISRNNVKSHEDMPDAIPSSEFAHEGSLDAKEIKHAWMLTPIKSKSGNFDLIFRYVAQKDENGQYNNLYYLSDPREGSRSSPSIRYQIRQML
jgi:hypothetical protein